MNSNLRKYIKNITFSQKKLIKILKIEQFIHFYDD